MQVHVTGWGYIALLNVVGVAAAMLHQKAVTECGSPKRERKIVSDES